LETTFLGNDIPWKKNPWNDIPWKKISLLCRIAERYIVPNIAFELKSGEDGKFQFSYFFLKVDYTTFPTSIVSPKSAKYISRYDLPK
jgi:hypothetical protein